MGFYVVWAESYNNLQPGPSYWVSASPPRYAHILTAVDTRHKGYKYIATLPPPESQHGLIAFEKVRHLWDYSQPCWYWRSHPQNVCWCENGRKHPLCPVYHP